VKGEMGVSCFTVRYLQKFKDIKASGFEKLQAIRKEPKSVIKHVQLIPLSVNCYELPNNFKEPTKIEQNWDQENKNAIDNRKERALKKKCLVIIIGYSHARWCVAELTLNLEENFEITGFVKTRPWLEVKTNMANEETKN
jgi:hypothetical protein